MKKFQFRLQRVLDYRNLLKREKELELAERNGELFIAEKKQEELLESYSRCGKDSEEVMNMAELMLHGDYQRYLRDAIDENECIVNEAIEAVEAARDAYVEKAIDSETLETLKHKRREEHKQEARKSERKKLDNLTVMRSKLVK